MADKEREKEKEKEKEKKRERSSALEPFGFGERGLLRPWAPFGRLMDELFSERFGAARWAPSVDVAENDDAYVITAELPGAKREDVSVEIHGDVVCIRGEKKCEREEKNERRHVVERSFGSFERSFTLPPNAAGDRIGATFKDGVLTVTIPKSEEQKPKQVDIKSA